jgi:hypothetical protein
LEVDSLTGGLPRGAITEILGSASSGRTSFMISALAYATTHEEVCVLIDTNDTFDPISAAEAGLNLERLLWIRCAANVEHALKATDLLLQGGGFGIVIEPSCRNVCDCRPPKDDWCNVQFGANWRHLVCEHACTAREAALVVRCRTRIDACADAVHDHLDE